MASLSQLFPLDNYATSTAPGSFTQVFVYNTNIDSLNNGGFCCLWTVPADTSWIRFETWGGGSSGGGSCCCQQPRQSGGAGAYARRTVAATPGETYTICAAGSTCCTPTCCGTEGYPSFVSGGTSASAVALCAAGAPAGCTGCFMFGGCTYTGNTETCRRQTRWIFKPVLEALVSLPLVLPPSVLGFYLLLAFSPKNSFGVWLEQNFDIRLVFSFEGLVVASVIFSLPFMVHPIQSGFAALPKNLTYAAYTLGKSKINTLFYVLLPNIRSSLLTGIVISFAHTIGEFGVVLMMGGSIAGETRVASIAIYDEVEALNYSVANQYALTLFIISFVILLFVYALNKHFMRQGMQ